MNWSRTHCAWHGDGGADDGIIYGALTRGVCVFKYAYMQMLDIMRKYYNSIFCLAVWYKQFHFCQAYDTILSVFS